MKRPFVLVFFAAALALGIGTPVWADQQFDHYSSGPTPHHTATPTPDVYDYIYYPCQSYPVANASCCGQGSGNGHGGGQGCNHIRPTARPSGRPVPTPYSRPRPRASRPSSSRPSSSRP